MKKYLVWSILIVPCLPMLIAWNRFIVPAGTSISDTLVTHFPNLLFIQRSFLNGDGIPLWSPLIFSGFPLSANPLSTLWYPPAWLALFFPLPLGINLVMAIHVFIGCVGMLYLLSALKISEMLVWLGGAGYGLLPAGFSHIAGGHFTWVCASAWLPWLLAFSTLQGKKFDKYSLYSACAIGLIMLADLRFAAYTVLIWLGQVIYLVVLDEKKAGFKRLTYAAGSLVLGLGISAVVWVPLIEFSGLSTRNLLSLNDSMTLSLPIISAFGLIIPGQPETIEWIIYLGAGLLVPGIYSLGLLHGNKALVFWWTVVILCSLWSIGEVFVVNRWLAELPGLQMLRVPARAMFFASFSILIISMISLANMVTGKIVNIKFFRLSVLGFMVLAVSFQIGNWIISPGQNVYLLFHVIITFVICVIVLVYTYKKVTTTLFLLIVSAGLIFDLALFDFNLVNFRTLDDALTNGAAELAYISDQGTDFRVFSPNYAIPQHTSAYAGIEMVGGIDPLQLRTYVNYIKKAAKIHEDGYSVTLPPYPTGDFVADSKDIQPDAALLGLLNTRFIITAHPTEKSGWKFETKIGNNFIYSNESAHGWAWLETGSTGEQVDYSSVTDIARRPNEIDLTVIGPGRLVLSEVNYPGWVAYVDGEKKEIVTAHDLLRSIQISEGTHTVNLRFMPLLTMYSSGVSLLTFLLCVILWMNTRKQ